MLNKILISLAIFMFAISIKAGELTTNPDKYIVVKDDTLWDVSGRFLEQPLARKRA